VGALTIVSFLHRLAGDDRPLFDLGLFDRVADGIGALTVVSFFHRIHYGADAFLQLLLIDSFGAVENFFFVHGLPALFIAGFEDLLVRSVAALRLAAGVSFTGRKLSTAAKASEDRVR